MTDDTETNGAATHGYQLKALNRKVDQLIDEQKKLTIQVALLAAKKECPDPGACLRLAAELSGPAGIVHRVAALELQREYLKGAWKSVVVASALVAAPVSAAATWLIGLLKAKT
jgi:hypothetical protein